jgi:hypothetical protein
MLDHPLPFGRRGVTCPHRRAYRRQHQAALGCDRRDARERYVEILVNVVAQRL